MNKTTGTIQRSHIFSRHVKICGSWSWKIRVKLWTRVKVTRNRMMTQVGQAAYQLMRHNEGNRLEPSPVGAFYEKSTHLSGTLTPGILNFDKTSPRGNWGPRTHLCKFQLQRSNDYGYEAARIFGILFAVVYAESCSFCKKWRLDIFHKWHYFLSKQLYLM